MQSRFNFLILIIILLLCTGLVNSQMKKSAGNVDSSAPPASTNSYTVEDIYNRINAGTSSSQSTFTEPSVSPGTATMHSLNDIMGVAPSVDNSNGSVAGDVLAGKTFWGLNGTAWGEQTGTMTNQGVVTYTPGTSAQTVAAGYHNGSGTVSGDADLIAANIKNGVDIFGVTGARFTDNGDDTITDNVTGLMWTKNANLPNGGKTPSQAGNYCDTLTFAGHTDWHLPKISEIGSLISHTNTDPALPTGHPFTNVRLWLYVTQSAGQCDSEHQVRVYLDMRSGISDVQEDNPAYVWPVKR